MPPRILKRSTRDSMCFEDSNEVKGTPRTRINSLLLKSKNLLRSPFSHDDKSKDRRKSTTRVTSNSRFRSSNIYEIITPRPSLPITVQRPTRAERRPTCACLTRSSPSSVYDPLQFDSLAPRYSIFARGTHSMVIPPTFDYWAWAPNDEGTSSGLPYDSEPPPYTPTSNGTTFHGDLTTNP